VKVGSDSSSPKPVESLFLILIVFGHKKKKEFRVKTALRPTTFSREPELMIRDLLSKQLDQTHSVSKC